MVNDDGGKSFSYQKRSLTRRLANWTAKRHVSVGPKTEPGAEASDNPPTIKSMSAAFLFGNEDFFILILLHLKMDKGSNFFFGYFKIEQFSLPF